jgi:hypothetical protein
MRGQSVVGRVAAWLRGLELVGLLAVGAVMALVAAIWGACKLWMLLVFWWHVALSDASPLPTCAPVCTTCGAVGAAAPSVAGPSPLPPGVRRYRGAAFG